MATFNVADLGNIGDAFAEDIAEHFEGAAFGTSRRRTFLVCEEEDWFSAALDICGPPA